MILSVTSSTPNAEQAPTVERFLADFLPALEREEGVAVYHFTDVDRDLAEHHHRRVAG